MAGNSKSRCQRDPPVANGFFLPARTAWIFILVSLVSIPLNKLSRFNQIHCQTNRKIMKRNLLFLIAFFLLLVAMFVVALYVPNSLPTNSDFSAIYNTDLALVNHVPIYDLSKVEVLAQQHSGIPP